MEGFVAAYGDPHVPEAWRETVVKVLRQRLCAHEHPGGGRRRAARGAALAARSRRGRSSRSSTLPVWSWRAATRPIPAIRYAVGERYAGGDPGRASCVVEDPGGSPLAWQGGQLSKVIAGVAARVTPERLHPGHQRSAHSTTVSRS